MTPAPRDAWRRGECTDPGSDVAQQHDLNLINHSRPILRQAVTPGTFDVEQRGGRRVLVVDDDEGVRTAVTWALEADGFEVVAVDNGLAAMDMIESSPLSLVVLDLSLPGLGGLDILRRLRTTEERERRLAGCRSSCCRDATARPTASSGSTSAPTTTS